MNCGLDLLGADDDDEGQPEAAPAAATPTAAAAVAATPIADAIKARIPKAELEAFEKQAEGLLSLEIDLSAPPAEQKKMALRNLDSVLKVGEKGTQFLLKYAKPEERAALVKEFDTNMASMETSASSPEEKSIVASVRQRLSAATAGTELDLSKAGKVVGGAFGGAVKGASYGAIAGAALLALLWRSNRIAGGLLGGLLVGPAVGAPVGLYLGAKKGAKDAGIETKPEAKQLPAAAKPVVAKPAAKPAVKSASFKPGDKIKGKDPTGKVQPGVVDKLDPTAPGMAYVKWADGSRSLSNLSALSRA